MKKIKRIIFVDSTISHDELNQYIHENDLLLPGIKRGDLIQILELYSCIESVVIIDGVFEQQASITHQEILWLISKGIIVTGLSSMGALRACELHGYGMLGYGRIFQNYHTGVLDGDDEVATSYFLSNDNSDKTIAMVNIRATLDKLNLYCEDLIFTIRKIHYKERNWLAIKAVIPNEIYSQLKLNYIDQKKEDVVSYFQNTPVRIEPGMTSVSGAVLNIRSAWIRKPLQNRYLIKELINQRYTGVIDFIENSLKLMPCGLIQAANLSSEATDIVSYLEYNDAYREKIASILFELRHFNYNYLRLKHFSEKIRREQKLLSSTEFTNYLEAKKISVHNLTALFEGILKLENYFFITGSVFL